MADNTVGIRISADDATGPGFSAAIARTAAFKASLTAMGIAGTAAGTGLTKAAASANAFGWIASTAGGRLGFLQGKLQLFGGAFGQAAFLGAIGGVHLLAQGILDAAAVIGPAIVATLAWGAAAGPTFRDIYQHLQAVNTVVQATGQNLAPMTGAFSRAVAAVKPSVYQLYGDAVTIATRKSGLFAQMAVGTGSVLDRLAARFTVAVTSGNGFSGWLRNAVPDVARLGDFIGNMGGSIGNVMRVLPGYAGALLNVAVAGSKVLEWATRVAQPVIGAGLAMHGAFIYAGLGGTLMARAIVPALQGISGLALRAGAAGGLVSRLGPAGERAAMGLRSLGVYAAGAAALPWGWIAVAAAGLGFLAYRLLTAKSATQQWLASMQATLQAAPAISAMTMLMHDQTLVSLRLAAAGATLKGATSNLIAQQQMAVSAYNRGNQATVSTIQQYQQLTVGARQLAAQNALGASRVAELAKAYGSTSTAQGLLIASGVTFGQLTTKNSYQLALMRQQVAATALAYTQMGQTGGILGADMAFLTRQTDGTFTAMMNLNRAADAWISLSTGLTGAQLAVDQAMTTMRTDAHAAGASFRGVNAASLTLRNDFNSLVPSVQQVIDGMRQAHASTRNLAAVVATDLSPAVKEGALRVAGMRDMIYTMAREAGYHGSDSVRGLSGWFDRNAVSVQKATDKVSNYSGSLVKVPKGVNTNFTSNVNAVWNSARNYAAFLGGLNGTSVSTYINQYTQTASLPGHVHKAAGGITGAAQSGGSRGGWTMVGEHGAEMVKLPPGTMVRSNPDTQRALAETGGNGGGPGRMQVEWVGFSPGDDFLRWLRASIRIRGGTGPGSVQRALGQ